tara:strand:+ start:226 stop:594 length:369 start_codon:yes stop_codon:yes gene_type:complete
MPDINEINGLVLCDEATVDTIAIASISGIDNISKNCISCNNISLGVSNFSCGRACVAECTTHYTDGDTSALLQVGDHIYENSDCDCPGSTTNLYYSNKCGGRGGVCYTIEASNCEIQSVSDC